MENSPFNPDASPAEKKPDSKEDKKKNASSRFAAVVPVARVEQAAENKPAAPKAFEKLFAGAAIGKPKEAAGAERLKDTAKKPTESGSETTSSAARTPDSQPPQAEKSEAVPTAGVGEATKPATTEKDEADNMEMKANTLPFSKLFGGEVVVDLGHEDEQVVNLRGTQPPVFNSQPMQQHQARRHEQPEDHSPEESVEESVSGESQAVRPESDQTAADAEQPGEFSPQVASHEQAENVSATPPEAVVPESATSYSFNTAENTPAATQPAAERIVPKPEDIYQQHVYQQGQEVVAGPSGERVATKQDVEDAIYYATKDGQRRGVVAGALFFGGYEHFKHRRREKRMVKEAKAQTRKFEHVQEDTRWRLREQASKQSQLERELQAQAATNAHEAVQKRRTMPEYSAGERPVERRFSVGKVSERLAAAKAEKGFKEKLEKLLPKAANKLGKAEAVLAAEQLSVPQDHRLETSAWHTIEVDAKTGKAVENPTFQYGREYYHERAQEAAPRDDKRDAAAGEVALVAAAMAANAASAGASSTQPASADFKGSPSASPQTSQPPQKTSSSSSSQDQPSTGPLWPWITAFVVVVLLILVSV